jgi:lysozyme family protein
MYTERFINMMKILLPIEGGKVDNPSDPGGRTNFGIIQKVYDKYRKTRELPLNDVFNISQEEVLEIYYRSYYLPLNIDTYITESVGYIIFDFAVNSGVSRSRKAFATNHSNPIDMLNFRRDFYIKLVQQRPESKIFLSGWLKRLLKISDHYGIGWSY